MTLKLIGAGLGRTGTASLKLAIDQLGFGPCYHMSEVIKNPAFGALWLRANAGEDVWDEIFDGYCATVDYPGCMFYKELADRFPQAKVLLSVREADKWFESVNETIMSEGMLAHIDGSPVGAVHKAIIQDRYDGRIFDRDYMIDAFNAHTEAVKAAIPAERLLVYEVKQGWGPLCDFLGVPIPDADFPRVNSRDEMKSMLARHQQGDGDALANAARELHGE